MQENELLQEIVEVVHTCGKIMCSATDIERKIHQKSGKGNFVTDYDSRVQAILEEKLLALVPEAVFLGEEDQMDHTDISKGYAFIVDPIDGTANFTRGYKASSISVALARDGYPVLGVVYNPYQEETFYALRGEGAFLNGERIHTSERTLEEGLVLFGTAPYYEELRKKTFEVAYRYFSQAEDLRRSGSAAIDLCMVACGRAEFSSRCGLVPGTMRQGPCWWRRPGDSSATWRGIP